MKDIQYLAHEPILNKFREFKIFVKKLTKALAKDDTGAAAKLEENKPIYTLDHIVKERFVSSFFNIYTNFSVVSSSLVVVLPKMVQGR